MAVRGARFRVSENPTLRLLSNVERGWFVNVTRLPRSTLICQMLVILSSWGTCRATVEWTVGITETIVLSTIKLSMFLD